MKVVVITTICNEEKNIGRVLARMPPDGDVIAIDDGSVDNSAQICRQYGARVVRHPFNLGQGAAFITGLRTCLMHDYDVIVHVDGDGQHDPQDIPIFLDKLEETGADIVVGSRILGSNYEGAPFFRRTFLPHFTWVINRITGYDMTDPMCGFRVFRADSLRRVQYVFDQIDEPQYMAAEMFVRFAREGLTVAEVPIHLAARESGVSRKGRDSLEDLVRYGGGVTKAIIRALWS